MLKEDWEKADQFERLNDAAIRGMAEASGRKLQSCIVISGGCANLNVKLVFTAGPPLILRVYLRDAAAADREQRLADRLKGFVPVPRVAHLGEYEGRRFALVEYAEGVTLRDLLLKEAGADVAPAVRQAGEMLAALRRVTFAAGGVFDAALNVIAAPPPDFIDFAQTSLAHPNVTTALTGKTALALARLLGECRADLPAEEAPCLVHGDYDPANILVVGAGGKWEISAVLDWEFAFSGSFLWDVSNMMRDAHRLPPVYGASFLEGLAAGGVPLPGNWRRSICLTNIFSLIYMLRQADPGAKPRARSDMAALVLHFMGELGRKSSFLGQPPKDL